MLLFTNLQVGYLNLIVETASLLVLFSSLLVAFAANAVYSVLFLVSVFFFLALLMIVLGAEYLGLMYMIVYIGAIAILFLFIIMLLDLRNLGRLRLSFSTIFYFVTTASSVTFFLISDYSFLPQLPYRYFPSLGSNVPWGSLGSDSLSFFSPLFFTSYSLYLVGCAFILLFVMIGVVLLLAEGLFPFREVPTFRNKVLASHLKVVKNTLLGNDF